MLGFDYGSLLEILDKKLEQMEKFFNSDQTHSVGAEKHAMEIHKCRLVLKRIFDDIYWKCQQFYLDNKAL